MNDKEGYRLINSGRAAEREEILRYLGALKKSKLSDKQKLQAIEKFLKSAQQ